MVSVLSEVEDEPADRPDFAQFVAPEIGQGRTDEAWATIASELDHDMLWARIEAWIAYRWGERTVTWIVEGPGQFVPRLTPATITATERWDGSAYVSATLDPSPLGGFELPGEGPYRITATVGDPNSPPAAVQEAFRRLALYIAETWDSLAPCGDTPSSWPARSMQYSGAADMLRPYRKA